jgi:serine/threonine protein kinase
MPLAGAASISAGGLETGVLLQNGKYSVQSVLGQGGFALTYKAMQMPIAQVVAIKEYFPLGAMRQGKTVLGNADIQAGKADFLSEGRTLAQFNHPSIVQVLDVFEENATAYIAMSFVPGQSLGQVLEAGALDVALASDYIRQAAEALVIVHNAGMLHQDLKPDNLVLTPKGEVVLIDFGAARVFLANKTGNYDKIVTPGYAPLEQYASQVRRGPYTDLYALAATAYTLMTGQEPPAATERAAGKALKSPRELNSQVSVALEKAILWGLEIRIEKRPQSVEAFLGAFEKGVSKRVKSTPVAPAGKNNSKPVPPAAVSAQQPPVQPVPPPVQPSPVQPSPPVMPVAPVQPPPVQPPPVAPPLPNHPTRPSLERAQQLLGQMLRLEGDLKNAEAAPWLCPVCYGGPLAAVVPGQGCPQCRVGTVVVPSNPGAAFACPCCRRGAMELVGQNERKPCPSCRTGELQPISLKTGGLGLRCPACRRAELENRVPNRRRCPHCRQGNLEARRDSAPRCANCAIGEVVIERKQRLLFLTDTSARCQHCQSSWEVIAGRFGDVWKLSQAGLVNGKPGRLVGYVGLSKVPEEWQTLSGRSRDGWRCDHCASEWDRSEDDRLRFAQASSASPLIGKTMSAFDWAKIAARLAPNRGSHHCPSCESEFDLEPGKMRFVASPKGLLAQEVGRVRPLEEWHRLAAGKSSSQDGFLCNHCGGEWDRERHGENEFVRLVRQGSGNQRVPEGAVVPLSYFSFLAQGKTSGQAGALCRTCLAEWDQAGDQYSLVKLGNSNGGNGSTSLGQSLTLAGWRARGLGRTHPETGPTCNHCGAEWVVRAQDWELVFVGHPNLRLGNARPTGSRMKPDDWLRLAAGKQTPGPGVVCPTCSSELSASGPDSFVLTNPPSSPLYGQNRHQHDWQRLARRLPLLGEESQLKTQAQAALRQAVVGGEWRNDESLFPRPPLAGEEVLFRVAAHSSRIERGVSIANEQGVLWLSSKRLVFDGVQTRTSDIPLDKISDIGVAGGQLIVTRRDRAKPITFFVAPFKARIISGGHFLETEVTVSELQELLGALR